MATLTIKNLPATLVRRLKRQAALHRRSLNLELIACLESAVQATPADAEAMLGRVRALRKTPARLRLTDGLLARLKPRGLA